MSETPLDFHLIYADKARPTFERVRAAAAEFAAASDQAATATTELSDTIRSLAADLPLIDLPPLTTRSSRDPLDDLHHPGDHRPGRRHRTTPLTAMTQPASTSATTTANVSPVLRPAKVIPAKQAVTRRTLPVKRGK